MEKILHNLFYWLSKAVRIILLGFCLFVIHLGFQELFAVGFGTGLQLVAACAGFITLSVLALAPIVGIVGIIEDIMAGV